MLVCLCSMTSLGSGINVIKNLALLTRIITSLLEAFPPVRIFYDDIDFLNYKNSIFKDKKVNDIDYISKENIK